MKDQKVKMPFLIIGNRLSEIRDRVKDCNESTAYTLELIDDAIKALETAHNSYGALLEACKRMFYEHSSGKITMNGDVAEIAFHAIAQAGARP